MGNIRSFAITIVALLNLSCVTPPVDDQGFYHALKEIHLGNIDFGFMELKGYLQQHPNSIHTQKIRFGICEYYFQIEAYRDAIFKLTDYIKDYPADESTVFAKALLYSAIAKYNQEPEVIEKIKEGFFSKSLFSIFFESKNRAYKSLLNNAYKIIDYSGEIGVFKNNELFLKITP